MRHAAIMILITDLGEDGSGAGGTKMNITIGTIECEFTWLDWLNSIGSLN